MYGSVYTHKHAPLSAHVSAVLYVIVLYLSLC